jgi:hypothetical protein
LMRAGVDGAHVLVANLRVPIFTALPACGHGFYPAVP